MRKYEEEPIRLQSDVSGETIILPAIPCNNYYWASATNAHRFVQLYDRIKGVHLEDVKQRNKDLSSYEDEKKLLAEVNAAAFTIGGNGRVARAKFSLREITFRRGEVPKHDADYYETETMESEDGTKYYSRLDKNANKGNWASHFANCGIIIEKVVDQGA